MDLLFDKFFEFQYRKKIVENQWYFVNTKDEDTQRNFAVMSHTRINEDRTEINKIFSFELERYENVHVCLYVYEWTSTFSHYIILDAKWNMLEQNLCYEKKGNGKICGHCLGMMQMFYNLPQSFSLLLSQINC